jgi:predicted nucleotidyltransferase
VDPAWSETVDALFNLAAANPGIAQLRVYGSAARPGVADAWSDLDVALIAVPGCESRLFPGLDWLAPLGEVWARELHSDGVSATVRLVFADTRRVDISLLRSDVSEAQRPGFALWTRTPQPVPVRQVNEFPANAACSDAMTQLAMAMRYEAVAAVCKLARGDLLIGAHLAYGLAQKVMVAGMLLRDRDAGTRQHRHGDSVWDRWVGANAVGGGFALNRRGVALGIGALAEQFDALAACWGAVPQVACGVLPSVLERLLADS